MSYQMLTIDGSQGEGGGQILRSSLALSMVTGKPFRIERIRAGRPKPGLMRQHLVAVNAAARISGAEVKGAAISSCELEFRPKAVKAGDYQFAIGSAGSTTLVFQTILPALMVADAPSTVLLEGGTHNPYAPPADFLIKTFLPILERMGPRVRLTLERPGFYPAGGGRMKIAIDPAPLQRIELSDRGEIQSRLCRAMVAGLSDDIGKRELKMIRSGLNWPEENLQVEQLSQAYGPGNVLLLEIASEYITEVVTGFGIRGVQAEAVAGEVLDQAKRYLAAGVPVGRYLADQLLVPMAMAGGGAFATLPLSRHSKTNADIIQKFLEISVETTQEAHDRWKVVVK
jgi:RNA 3'-terminal phosphate cyclase (ATP)